jgi:sec-independent protein translocase protein TatA
MPNIGMQELVVIFLIILLIFGGKKIPEIARGIGKGIREFRKAKDDVTDSLDEKPASPEAKSVAPPPVTPPVDDKK